MAVEKYPFGLLTMIVSLEAIFLSTFVMISQNRADARRQVIADQQWRTVQEEDEQNEQLLDLSRRTLALTEQVHDAAGAGGAASPGSTGTPRTRSKTMPEAFGGRGGAIRNILRRRAFLHLSSVRVQPPRDRGWQHSSKEVDIAISDQLTGLAARAKEAEDRAAAAQGKGKADLQADVETARASAQSQAQKLRESADANQNKLLVWRNDQRSWNEHVAKIRDDIDTNRAEHDADRAEKIAAKTEDDAAFAVEFAYAAIEEAEYAVLDATLARAEADEASAA